MWQDERLQELKDFGVKGLIIGVIIGLVCGIFMFRITLLVDSVFAALFTGLFSFAFGTWYFSAIPYGWHCVNKVVGGWTILGSPLIMFFAIAAKIVFAVCMGSFLYYPKLIRTIIRIKFFEKGQVQENLFNDIE